MSVADFRELHTGDTSDDDAQVIDSLVQPQANPPAPLPDEMTETVTKRPAQRTRIQTERVVLQTAWDPVKILNPDADRKVLTVSINSASATDFVTVGDEPNNAKNGGSIFQANPLTLLGHTGALWVYNPTVNAITVSYWTVTL